MAVSILKDQTVYFDGYDLTGRTNVIALEFGAEAKDNTVLGTATRTMIGGLKTNAAQVEGFMDIDATDKSLFDGMGVAGNILTFGASDDAVGSVTYSMKAIENEFGIGGAVGDVSPFSFGAQGDGNLIRSTMMLNSIATPLTSTANGTGQQVGAASATETIYAHMHVLGAGTGSVTVTIESDATNSFSGSETTRLTFNAATGIESQEQTLAGAVTDTWWRAVATISGGAPSFKLIIVVGIL